MPAPEPPALDGAKDYRERYEELTGCSLWQCPVCHKGRMLAIEILPRNHSRQTAITESQGFPASTKSFVTRSSPSISYQLYAHYGKLNTTPFSATYRELPGAPRRVPAGAFLFNLI